MTLPPDGPFAENLALFRERFPGLYGMYAAPLSAPDAALAALEGEGMEVLEARSGKPSLRFAGRLIHSLQDPQKEAERLLDAEVKALGEAPGSFVFYGFGLGYLPAAAAEKFPGAALALIEPDVRRFILALGWVDWRRVFASPSCAVFLGADVHTAADFVEGLGEGRVIFSLPQYTAHGGDYFSALKTLVNLRVQKKHVNARTLDAFGKRWLRNSARNLPMLASCPGVNRLSGRAGGLPCCVLAAGPTLDSVIPFLEDLSRRSVVIAVDTALRACLRAGVEPDFVVLGDPQFWNAQHLSGLCARSSILVTEIACYPPVMRFPCRGVVLFDSLYPLGEYFSRALSLPKGALASGGSVAASAWDLARVLGAGEIWVAGLDLGFPGGRTHARGSLFEETIHARSVRLAPAETQGAAALFSARSVLAGDYHGVPLRSDERMTLYAWWFENEF
ncbi:MAG: DUF115 domain-containing protein, partial [Spirochaetaceae bacterium]|nr:DUF115 domain-containing protein [Spirochaetaceae bacterium]